jgi:hypothetical protein
MIKHETEIPAAAVWPHVGERLRLGVPLGAYALDHRVRYLFLEERGVQVLSAHTERGQLVEAVSPYLPGLQCDEQEMADDYGVTFDGLSGPDTGEATGRTTTPGGQASQGVDTTTFPYGLDALTSPFSTRGPFASLRAKSAKFHGSSGEWNKTGAGAAKLRPWNPISFRDTNDRKSYADRRSGLASAFVATGARRVASSASAASSRSVC